MTRVYLSGPMKGIAELNYHAFKTMAAALTQRGYEVCNPADIGDQLATLHLANRRAPPTYGQYLRADIAELVKCDALFLLPGWEGSDGALLEYEIAKAIGMEILHE